jgi:hypothetical protein
VVAAAIKKLDYPLENDRVNSNPSEGLFQQLQYKANEAANV